MRSAAEVDHTPAIVASLNRIATKPAYKAGYIEITDAPGIGVELNADAVKEMAQPGFSL